MSFSNVFRAALILSAAVMTTTAAAQWSTDPNKNNPICTAPGDQWSPVMTSDGAGGTLMAWYDERGGKSDIYAQRISSSGTILWKTNGVPVCTAAGDQESCRIVGDDSGGAILSWADHRGTTEDIYAQRISSNGVSQWITDGVAVDTAAGAHFYPAMVSDGNGGAIIAWMATRSSTYLVNIYAQRIDPSGKVLWGTNGVLIDTAANSLYPHAITDDGSGGAIIAWVDRRSSIDNVYAQHISSTGYLQWSDDGIPVTSTAGTQENVQLIGDGNGGTFITWNTGYGSSDIYAQRLSSMGTAEWTANGVAVSQATGDQDNPQIVSDDQGGVIITWEDWRNGSTTRDIYAQRLSGTGTVLWTTDGVAVCTAEGDQSYPEITSDNWGGAIITWPDFRYGNGYSGQIYAQLITSSGAAGWKTNGVAVSVAYGDKQALAVRSDESGGAILAWCNNAGHSYDIYAQRLDRFGNLYPAPWITRAADIANDQGGKIRLMWNASQIDKWPETTVQSYTVLMGVKSQVLVGKAEPVNVKGTAKAAGDTVYWQTLGTVPANYSQAYNVPVTTLSDSGPQGIPWYYFKVKANSANNEIFWTSNVDSGYSVDNIPPPIPTSVSVVQAGNGVAVSWKDSTATDLLGFQIFRSTANVVNLDSTKPIAFVKTTDYTDGDPLLNAKAFYFVRAEDIHGNFSALASPASITIGTTGKIVWAQTTGPYGGEVHALLARNNGTLLAGTSQGGVYTSSNSGTSWTQISSGISTLEIASLAEGASGDLFAGSDGDGIYMSTDNGTSWANSSLGLPDGEYVESIKVLKNGYIVAASYNDGLYYSKDGGKNWTVSSDASNGGSAFVQDTDGKVYCGTGNGVEVSTDNGKSWTVTGLANRNVLCLLLGLNGTMYAGTDGGVFVTSDHGSTWTTSGLPNQYLHSLVMDAAGNLFAGTDGNGVFMSTDNGSTWKEANDSLSDVEIESLAIDGSGQLYAGTYGYGVFRAYRTTGGTTGVQQSQAGIPKDYELSQNYPNPFNPTTAIRYQLSAVSQVSLKVYDVLGREVATLVNEVQKIGRYEVTFDGSRLASGVYFYRLVAEGDNGKRFMSTRKLVLMK